MTNQALNRWNERFAAPGLLQPYAEDRPFATRSGPETVRLVIPKVHGAGRCNIESWVMRA